MDSFSRRDAVVAGNPTDKYGSRNPLIKLVVNNFIRNVGAFIKRSNKRSVLDVGCGNGEFSFILKPSLGDITLTALDLSLDIVREGAERYPEFDFIAGSGEMLPFNDNSFDLVLGCEILEHVHDPVKTLYEMMRVCRLHLILSVPLEPAWRIFNMLSGRYWAALGNSPGHINHWTYRGFLRFLSDNVEVADYKISFPWIVALCEARSA